AITRGKAGVIAIIFLPSRKHRNNMSMFSGRIFAQADVPTAEILLVFLASLRNHISPNPQGEKYYVQTRDHRIGRNRLQDSYGAARERPNFQRGARGASRTFARALPAARFGSRKIRCDQEVRGIARSRAPEPAD